MLIQFRVENHRSLRDEQLLSLVASDDLDPSDKRLIPAEPLDVKLLPAVGLYGANASGKSNVIRAFEFMRDAVLDSHRKWEPQEAISLDPFALSEEHSIKPSVFEVDFILKSTHFRYGFVLSSKRVEEEWLYSFQNGQKAAWFERERDLFSFGDRLVGDNDIIRRLTRPNSLYLSAAAQNNHAGLIPIFGWFQSAQYAVRRDLSGGLRLVSKLLLYRVFGRNWQRELSAEDSRTQDRYRKAIVGLLKAADTGIVDMEAIKPADVDAGQDYRQSLGSIELRLLHKTSDDRGVWLPHHKESAGTITLLNTAMPLLEALEQGNLLCIDELESSLHPLLALELLKLFQNPETNPNHAQLIFTTHDTNLLGNPLGEAALRRDQVWLTEKDQSGATQLYPLTDIEPKQEENLQRGYLQGRYGAIPFLQNLASVVPRTENR